MGSGTLHIGVGICGGSCGSRGSHSGIASNRDHCVCYTSINVCFHSEKKGKGKQVETFRMLYVRPIQALWLLWIYPGWFYEKNAPGSIQYAFSDLESRINRLLPQDLPIRRAMKWGFMVVVVVFLVWLLMATSIIATEAAGPEDARAYDNQSISTQPTSVQQMFFSAFGANAQVRWIIEHTQELFDRSPWGYVWGPGGPHITGPFTYVRGTKVGGAYQETRLFTSLLHGPYVVQSYQFTLPSTRETYRGAQGKGCETMIHPQLDYQQVTLRQGSCTTGDSYKYPYIRADGTKGNRVPVPHPTRPNEYPMTGIFGSSNGSFKWQIWADDGNMNLVVEVWSTSYKPILQVRIPQGQALEIKLPCNTGKDGFTPVTFWNDEQGWHYLWGKSGLEAIQEGGPIWSLWRASFLTIREDGTAEYEELPFWKAQG